MEVKINQGALFFAIFVFLCCIAFFVGVYDMIHVHREETLIEKIVIDENSWVKTVRYDVKPRPIYRCYCSVFNMFHNKSHFSCRLILLDSFWILTITFIFFFYIFIFLMCL